MDFLKCSSKICWLTFQKTMDLFATIDTKTVEPYLDKYLVQACAEDDEMWLSNLHLLAKNLK